MDGNTHDSLAWANLGDAQRFVPHKAEESKASYRRALHLLEADVTNRPQVEGLHSRLALYAAKAGDHEKAKAALEIVMPRPQKETITYFRLMVTHELLGNRDAALKSMLQALDAGYPTVEIANDPYLDELRQDPKYHDIINRRI